MSEHSSELNTNDDRLAAPAETVSAHDNLVEKVLNSVGECVYEWDIQSDALHWGDGICDILFLENIDSISTNRRFNNLLQANTEQTRDRKIQSSRAIDAGQGVPFNLQYALSSKLINTPHDMWVEDTGRWFADENGKPVRAHGVIRLINERRNNQERLNRLSRFDVLTGLYNRTHLNFCLENTFEDVARSGEPASFIVVGLEHFDLINSVYGYEAGDAVITEVAKRLTENLRDSDIVARFSGAKIGIILPECGDRDMLVAGHRILNLLRENVVVTDKGSIAIAISIGGVVMPTQARTSREVFVAAQQAILDSRRSRDTAIVAYRHDTAREAQQINDAKTAERIINALKDGHIHLVFQPIVDAKTSKIQFYEALIRLHQPDGDTLTAHDFVGIAERLGLIRMVDHYALDLALEVLANAPTAVFSLNVSNETAMDPEWLSKLAHAIHDQPDISHRLIVEITESHAAESMTEARRFIDQVHDLGCRIALDDFGAGFTSFRNLKDLPFDIIKVDGQFVDDLENSHINQSFIKALVDLAKLFDVETVVEWVEDDGTAKLLKDWGVTYLQGYAFGKPQRNLPWPTIDDLTDDVEESAVA